MEGPEDAPRAEDCPPTLRPWQALVVEQHGVHIRFDPWSVRSPAEVHVERADGDREAWTIRLDPPRSLDKPALVQLESEAALGDGGGRLRVAWADGPPDVRATRWHPQRPIATPADVAAVAAETTRLGTFRVQ